MRQQRWYVIEDGKLVVYNQPRKSQATFVSMTRLEDLAWYRSRFDLQRIWEE